MKRKFTFLMAAFMLLAFLAVPMGMRGQAPVNTVLWSETWTDGSTNPAATPSTYNFTGTTVYGDATLTYTQDDNGTKLYNENNAGGTAPELLLKSGNKTWTISNIPTGSATELELTFKANYDRTVVTSATTGVTIGTKSFSNKTVTYPITVASNVTSFSLTFTNTTSSNVRIDNIELVVTTAGSGGGPQLTPTTTSITAPQNFNNDLYVSTDAGQLNVSVTYGSGTDVPNATVTWSSTNEGVATVTNDGTVTLVATGTTDIKATYAGDNTTYAGSYGTYQLTVVDNTPSSGTDVAFDATSDLGNSTAGAGSIIKNGVTFQCNNGILGNGSEYRLYKNSTTTFSTTSGNITKIVFTCKSGNPASGFTSQAGLVISGNDATWTGSANSISFVASNKQVQATLIVVTVEGASSVEAPSFSPASGTTFGNEGLQVTLTQVDGKAIYYNINSNSDPDANSTLYSEPINITTTSTIKAVAKDGDEYSGVVTAVYTFIDPNAPGTENNPYTVAQARAAIDANFGTQGVYARGIVSEIGTAWNNNYITFNFVDNSGDSDFLQAYRCISGANADASAVAVGDIVVVYGNLTKFNTTYEFAKDCELVSLEHPTISVESPSFVLAEGGYATTQNVTLTCATQGATIYYTTNGDTPNNNSTEYNGAIEVSSTTTIKAIAYLNSDASLVSSATYYILSNENNNTVTQALAFGSYPANNVFVHGIVSTAPTEDPNNGALTYYISVNGEATDQLQVYKGKNLNRADFTSQEDIQVGDIVTIFGNVKIYSNQKEFDQGNYLVTFERPVVHTLTVDPTMVSVDSQIHDGNLSISYVNLNIADENNFDVNYYESDGTTTADYSSWLDAVVMEENNAYIVYYQIGANTDNAPRTGYMRVYVYDEDGIELESDLITVTQAAYTVPSNWVLTSLADLSPADVFVIVGDNGDTYALPSTPTTSAPVATKIGINTGTDPYTLVSNPETALQWNLSIGNYGYVFYPYNTTDKWLNCTNSNNGVKVGDNDSNAKHFTLADNGYLTTTETTSQRYLGVYNSQDWRTYDNVTGNISGQSFSFYKKVSADVQYEKQNIVAYTSSKDHYYLIASPVASVDPATAGSGFLTSAYDLYYFDESQGGSEWRNYEATSFNLVSGKGYLYASNTATDLTFSGQPYNGNGLVELAYTDGKPFAGWNLIGNPFATAATLNMPFYKMNDNGDGFTSKIEDLTNTISAMEGVFVQATAANQNAIFTAQTRGGEKNGIARVDFNVTNTQGKVVDNAIVRFDNGATLEKFYFGNAGASIYFAQDNKEFSIVRSEARGEMPVNFKAAENGTYTIDVEAENLEVNYLHLIDNLTGMDVDLLATPSYTFEARKSDIASRFRLVFDANTGNDETNDNFAFINNGELIVNGNGTVQVIDILGRQMFSHEVNSAFRIQNSEFVPGVYVLRLVNGNDVKTQKIVIK